MVVTNKSIVKNHLNLTKFFFIFFVFELIISCKNKCFLVFSQILPLCSGIIHRRHLFSHCHYIYYKSQDDDESQSEKQIDIISFSLDEITEAVASLVVFIKIYPVVLNHGIAHDYGEQQKKQCHNENSLFLFRESLYHISHGAKIVFFFGKRCPLPPLRCLLPTK